MNGGGDSMHIGALALHLMTNTAVTGATFDKVGEHAQAGRGRDVYWVAGEGPHILARLFPDAGITGPDNGYALVVANAGREAAWVGQAAYHGRWLRWRP